MPLSSTNSECIETPRGTPHIGIFQQNSKSTAKKLIRVANTVAFELNKATLRIRRGLTPTVYKNDAFCLTPTAKLSFRSRCGLDRVDLFTQMSSLGSAAKSPNCLSPSRSSAPNILLRYSSKTTLLHLPSGIIFRILLHLDGRSTFACARVCQLLRTVSHQHSDELEKVDVTSHELIIGVNRESGYADVRALRIRRSINDIVYQASCIEEIIPPLIRCLARITFCNGVNVSDWSAELEYLHFMNRLRPLALLFIGGNFTKGNQLGGADLRAFTEEEFVTFIGYFFPHIQEVQLATTRLFKPAASPPRLLSLISLVTCFGITYERPALRYFFDDIRRISSYWRHDPLSRSCSLYIRRPHGASVRKWTELGGETEMKGDIVVRVSIPHFFMTALFLNIHLH